MCECANVRDPLFLLISGGPDSVYLFHRYLKKKKKFTVIHFNHHLRGEESDAEQRFVEDLCRRHGVPCLVCDIHLVGGVGIQERARQERLRFCFELGGGVFVTAHHADDVLETLVMRLRRGAGLKGLTGIRSRVTMTSDDGLTKLVLMRPLLHLTKKKIVSELEKKKISFCVDSSNSKKKYFRNRVRSELGQTKLTWESKKSLLKSARLLQLIDDHFTQSFENALKTFDHFVPNSVWSAWPKEIQFRFFARRMKENGFRQQVENKHFQIAVQKRVLQLGPARFSQKKAGVYFR